MVSAHLLPREDADIRGGSWDAMGLRGTASIDYAISGEAGVTFSQGCRAGQPQFLDQPVQGLVRTLDPTLRWARIRADDIYVERVQCPAELGHTVTAKCTGMGDPDDGVLIAVEGDRFAPGLQIGAGDMEIGESRLALDELQM